MYGNSMQVILVLIQSCALLDLSVCFFCNLVNIGTLLQDLSSLATLFEADPELRALATNKDSCMTVMACKSAVPALLLLCYHIEARVLLSADASGPVHVYLLFQ